MSMSHKERTLHALNHEPVDRIPTQVNYTRAMGKIMAIHFGVPTTELDDYLDNHMIRVDISYEQNRSEDDKVVFDWWGAGFSTEEEGYLPVVFPLKENKDLNAFPWPDPHTAGLLDQAAVMIRDDQGEHFIVPNFGFVLFERAWTLRGFDDFLMDMVLDPGFAEDLLERITEIQTVLIKRFLQLGVDGAYFGDDYGAQKNMLFSPQMWRKFIKPRLARLFAPFRGANLPVLMHSDGQIIDILEDLVEIGLTTLNPVQPEVTDQSLLKRTFKKRLSYYGGISTQTVLPHGSPGEVKDSVKDCISRLAPEKTGLLAAPSHRMMTDIPLENVEAMLDAFGIYR